jgi:hypothetical protein
MNYKKYTYFKKKTFTAVMFFTILYVFGCGPKEIPKAIIPPPPKKTESVLPNIKKLDSDIVKIIDNGNKLGSKIEESKNIVSEQKISILEALAQAEKIKEKALANVAISELEALNLIKELKKVESRNLFLETQNNQLRILKDEQEQILKIIQNTLNATQQQVIYKEEEASQLREQNKYLADSLSLKNNESDKFKKLLQKEKEISASAKVYKNWVIGLISGFILWTIIKNILMIYLPTTKFRL